MGYHLNSIYSISPDDTHSYFIFMIGGLYGLVNSTQEWLDKNFNAIAKALGPNAAIVRGLSSNFEEEVINAYQEQVKTQVIDFHVNERAIDGIVSGLSRQYRIRMETPLLFITNKNPHKIADESSVFYIIPVGGLAEIEVQNVIETILSCIQTNKFDKLDKWILKKFGNTSLNALKTLNEVVELKPGFAGISINLNEIIERFMKKGDS